MKKTLLLLLLATGMSVGAQSNYALSFNGTNYVDCGNSGSFNANTIRTMECWVKFNNLSGDQEILSKSIVGQGIELLIYSGNLAAYFMRDGTNYSFIAYPTTNLSTGVWYHIAMSWDGTKENIRLYVNGAAVGTRTDGGNINTTGLTNPAGNFRIGNWADPSARYFNGIIDEARIWNVNRTAAQIKNDMFQIGTDQTGLLAYYKMNAGSGTSLPNSTATPGLTGTLTGTSPTFTLPAWVASPVIKNPNALGFDGSNDYVDLGTAGSLKPSAALTEEFWVKPANWNPANEQELISCFESSGYGMYLSGGNLFFRLWPSGASGYRGVSYPVSNLTNNTWYHLAGTFDGRYIQLYVNGVLVGTDDLGSTKTVSYIANNFLIGADAGGVGQVPDGMYFNGQIDEVRIWNVARTQAQVQASMNAELNSSDAVQTTGLVAYYTFNQGTASGTNTDLATVIDQKGTANGRLTNFALTGTASNYVTQQSGITVLPVTYLSFTAQRQGSGVSLQWSTAQEQNSSYFTLQYSVDNRTWNNIGSVPAAGNSNEVRNYSYVHTNSAKGIIRYRIVQTDRDGKNSYSQIRAVSLNESTAANVMYNYISGNRIQMQLEEPTLVRLYSQDGRLLLQKQLAEGLQAVDVSGFAKGIYLLKAGDRTEKISIQ